MGIEGGSSGGFERSRSIEDKIEGQWEKSITELLIDQATHIPLPPSITWSTAQFSFEQVGRYTIPKRFGMSESIPLYAGILEYLDKQRKLRTSTLSLLTSKQKPILFTGTTDGFYAHDPLMSGNNNPFYVVGLHVDELEERMSRMAGTWHEIGHVGIFHANYDTQLLQAAVTLKAKDLPPVAQSLKYSNLLAPHIPEDYRTHMQQASPMNRVRRHDMTRLSAINHRIDAGIHLFHERNAWAAGMNIVRENHFPTGFNDDKSYFDYARLCLASYGRYYRDQKFVKGFRR